MFSLILRSIFQGRLRSTLLVMGLLAVSTGVLLVAAASETTAVTVDQDLTRYWRTTYDILVRPAGARSPIEEKYGLVETNHLSGIAGGITITQSETIRAIPGVEVAAPIAMLGYVFEVFQIDMGRPSDPGPYVVTQTRTVDDGARLYDQPRYTYYYVGPDAPAPSLEQARRSNIIVNPLFGMPAWLEMPFFVAGVDPPQEAALVGLDRILLEGEYLTGNEPLNPRPYTAPFDKSPRALIKIPVLINTTPYISITLRAELKRLSLPPEAANLEAIMAHGGREYLASLPGEMLTLREISSDTAYRRVVESLRSTAGYGFTNHAFATGTPSRITYREIQPPFPHDELALEIVLPGGPGYGGEPAYRTFVDPRYEEARFNAVFQMNATGVFDIERLPKPTDVNRVPLETYFPPLAILRYDEEGRPVEPRTLRPTLNPAGYIQSPPLILTTLAAARALRGEECISAVRVRVGGIDQLTPAAQRKIEAVASEIVRRTGLTVDVMVGSSPRRVLVRVPGVGYVEEGWIQKGVNLSYQRRVQSGHLLLLATLLGVGGLFALDLAWADLLARRRTIALQKALGWRSRTVFWQVLGQALLVGVIAAVAGALSAWGVAATLGWALPSGPLLVGVPLLTVGMCLAGNLYPAWLATRLPPIPVLQAGGVRYTRTTARRLTGLSHYAWRSLSRRWSRTLLSGLAAVFSSALLVLLLAVTMERQGYLVGTLLGEYILVRIERYHYAIVAISFSLTALLIANSLLTSVLERRREIGVLKAVGWRTTTVTRLFVVEGMLLGLMGGAAGTLLGLGAFLGLYQALLPGLAQIALLGVFVPALVGALAALHPARVAARVPPAEAVRYE